MSDLKEVLETGVDRGVSWLKGHQREDGAFAGAEGEFAAYYKAPFAFGVTGALKEGAACLHYIEAEFLKEDGDFRSNDVKTGLTRLQRNLANYMNGWVAVGAWLTGQFGLAESAVRFLVRQQSEDTGGVLTGRAEDAGADRYDLASTSSAGLAFLVTGHRDNAQSAGRYLETALTWQQDASKRLEVCFDGSGRSLRPRDDSEATYYSVDLSRSGEKAWFPAFAVGFLAKLYEIEGRPEILVAAQQYFDVITRMIEFRERTLSNGKSGWAASLLAGATGEERYYSAIEMIAGNVLARQQPDGEFAQSLARRGTVPLANRFDRTAEFTGWTAEYLRFVSGRRGPPRS